VRFLCSHARTGATWLTYIDAVAEAHALRELGLERKQGSVKEKKKGAGKKEAPGPAAAKIEHTVNSLRQSANFAANDLSVCLSALLRGGVAAMLRDVRPEPLRAVASMLGEGCKSVGQVLDIFVGEQKAAFTAELKCDITPIQPPYAARLTL
jgi:hypothetical protein